MRRALAVVLVLFIYGTLGLGQEAAEKPLPNDYTEKVDATPSVRRLEDTVLGHGVANAPLAAFAGPLLWLNDHGYPGLVPEGGGDTPASTRLMNALAESIGANNSSDVLEVLAGLDRYCATRGYDAIIEFQGWPAAGKYAVALQPALRWVLDGARGDSSVVLLIGSYSHDTAKDLYRYIESYWAALLGYVGGNRRTVRVMLTDGGTGKGHQTTVVTPLETGTFAAYGHYPAGPAAGWLTVAQVRLDNFLVIDGAIRFRLQKHQAPEADAAAEPEKAPATTTPGP